MLTTNIKTAWRNLRKHKSVTLINFIGLATGMSAAILIMLWVQNEMSFDKFHPAADRIYRVTNSFKVNKEETWTWDNSPMPLGTIAKERLPQVEQVTRLLKASWDKPAVRTKDKTVRQSVYGFVDERWFDVFHYDFIKGSAKDFNSEPFSMALTESRAAVLFGNSNPIGERVMLDSTAYIVRAIIKDNPNNSSLQFDMLVPLKARHLSNPNSFKDDNGFDFFSFITFIKLKENSDAKQTAKSMSQIYLDKRGAEYKTQVTLVPLPDLHFDKLVPSPQLPTGDKKLVYVFTILAGLLLFTACINYVNLTTARATLRAKEVSVKKIIGADRMQLFLQFVTESIMVSVAALLLTLLLTAIALPYFNQLTEKTFTLPYDSGSFWAMILGTLATAIILNSVYPALLLSSFKPISIFRGVNALKIRDGYLRKGLVVLQFSFSICLIIGSIVIYRQMKYVREKDAGYDRSLVYSVNVPMKWLITVNTEKRNSVKNSIRESLLVNSAIQQVSNGKESIVNMESTTSGGMWWKGKPDDFNPVTSRYSADFAFADLFHMTLIEGRWFEKDNQADRKNFVLNETAVKTYKLEHPVVGQRFVMHGDTGQIVGVTKDIHYKSFKEKIGPQVYQSNTERAPAYYIKPAPGQTAKALQVTEQVWKKQFPGAPFEYRFVEDEYESLYKTEQKSGQLVLIFSGLAILIACLGLFGLATFAAQQRAKEIGIRKVLGASVQNIVQLLSKDFLILVLVAAVVSSPVAWYFMSKWLEDFQYRINLSGWVLALAAGMALLVALATVSFKAISAALANPVKSIRNE